MSKLIEPDYISPELVIKLRKEIMSYATLHNMEMLAKREGNIDTEVESRFAKLYYKGDILLILQDIGLL